jgi:hypothetical protein
VVKLCKLGIEELRGYSLNPEEGNRGLVYDIGEISM